MRPYAPLLVVGVHFVLAIAYNLTTPFGNNGYANTPDESAHFQYVAYVAHHWRLPIFEGYEGVGYEAHQPPLYYFLAGLAYHLVGGRGERGASVFDSVFGWGGVACVAYCASAFP